MALALPMSPSPAALKAKRDWPLEQLQIMIEVGGKGINHAIMMGVGSLTWHLRCIYIYV
jgi:hypothetical protein